VEDGVVEVTEKNGRSVGFGEFDHDVTGVEIRVNEVVKEEHVLHIKMSWENIYQV
jgi:hypothetical protein